PAGFENDGCLVLIIVGLTQLARCFRQLLTNVLGQFFDADQAIGLVAVLVRLAVKSVENNTRKQAVLFHLHRRFKAVAGQENHAAGSGGVGLLILAEKALEETADVGIRSRVLARVEALEVDVDKCTKTMAF